MVCAGVGGTQGMWALGLLLLFLGWNALPAANDM